MLFRGKYILIFFNEQGLLLKDAHRARPCSGPSTCGRDSSRIFSAIRIQSLLRSTAESETVGQIGKGYDTLPALIKMLLSNALAAGWGVFVYPITSLFLEHSPV